MQADRFSWCTTSKYESKKSESVGFAEIAAGGLYKAYFLISENASNGAIVMDSVVADKDEQFSRVGLDVEVLEQDSLFKFDVNGRGIMTPNEEIRVRVAKDRLLVVEQGFLTSHDLSQELDEIIQTMGLQALTAV